jgi:adenylate kinase family enzyme
MPDAILLIGPTGSGKTPLGEHLAAHGLGGRPCAHFDFGHQLRRIAADAPADFTTDELAFIRDVLESGALLENAHWPLAEKILRRFLAAHRQGTGTGVHEGTRVPVPTPLIVLNGLPRHAGQARDIARLLAVRAVVELRCSAATVLHRLATDAGGDRAGRVDDGVEAVRRKLAIYQERIAPLVAFYRERGVAVVTIEVRAETTAAELAEKVSDTLGRRLRRPSASAPPGV